jgi:hypothetical protein
MQLMSWTISRLGSRFSLHFEPYKRRVLHSALGCFFDRPLDLMVGLIEPDGTERVLPFSQQGKPLYNCEQFERMNSITYRGYSQHYRLRFEFNIHSVFYPRDDDLCTMPAFYIELRVSSVDHVRWTKADGPTPERVKLFVRLNRPDTEISAHHVGKTQGENPIDIGPQIDLQYQVDANPKLSASMDRPEEFGPMPAIEPDRTFNVHECIASLNADAQLDASGSGLILELPVVDASEGVKWRLVWGAHCGDPIMRFDLDNPQSSVRFKYAAKHDSIDAIMHDAIDQRDDRLNHSRRFEKIFDQTQLNQAQRHLIHQSFQSFLGNTFWSEVTDLSHGTNENKSGPREWFANMEGASLYLSTMDVEYNICLWYLAIWPGLLAMQLDQWPVFEVRHEPSEGGYLRHDLGQGTHLTGQAFGHDMEVEENCNYLLMLQAYTHWTGKTAVAKRHAELIARLARYLIWTDQDGSGFPSEGIANTLADASPASQFARKQTYLAVKRLTALRAAGDLLRILDENDLAHRCEKMVETDAQKVEEQAWLGDHYAVCVDRSAVGLIDSSTGDPLPYEELPGWDAYSIYTANGVLLPSIIGQPCPFDIERLLKDLTSARRETLGPYGCGHSSYEINNIWVSQNLWRDHLARYQGLEEQITAERYWDMQVMSNTGDLSLGFVDSYIGNNLCFTPRGITSIGYLLAYPRLVVDRLAAGGSKITVAPDRHYAQRWPLIALADWRAGKIPVCVVDHHGNVTIEGEIDPVIIKGQPADQTDVIG